VRCEAAQQELSAAIDEPAPMPAEIERHVGSCPRCTRYASELHRLHQVTRLSAAPAVPDLAPAIMQRVRQERLASPDRGDAPVPLAKRKERRFPVRRGVAAAVAAGLVIGYVLGSGGLPNRGGGSRALAAEIPHRLVHAAVELRGYRATFDITERNWSPRVRLRRFTARIGYRAPESFRVDVTDRTTYHSDTWPRNDETLVTDGRSWRITGANPCPPQELPACHPDTVDRTVVHRAPFDADTQTPTDIIVPMTVLAAADRVNVVGPDSVDGRDAEVVSLSYEDATPLFAYLRFLGSWRTFYPQDRVLIWLDASTWFPLRYEVYPAPGEERRLWAAQMGIAGDRPGRAVFDATVRTLSTTVPPSSMFDVTAGGSSFDEGFRNDPSVGTARVMRPELLFGLAPVRAGRFAVSPVRRYRARTAAYARGLAWATVTRITGWTQRRLFGVDDLAERVALGIDRGVGYYEPATSTQPRRMAIHSQAGELLVATNLSRDRLVRMAGSLPVVGRPAPASWLVRRWSGGVVRSGLTVSEAVRRASFGVLIPAALPSGYRP
jgi:hypothetical protein